MLMSLEKAGPISPCRNVPFSFSASLITLFWLFLVHNYFSYVRHHNNIPCAEQPLHWVGGLPTHRPKDIGPSETMQLLVVASPVSEASVQGQHSHSTRAKHVAWEYRRQAASGCIIVSWASPISLDIGVCVIFWICVVLLWSLAVKPRKSCPVGSSQEPEWFVEWTGSGRTKMVGGRAKMVGGRGERGRNMGKEGGGEGEMERKGGRGGGDYALPYWIMDPCVATLGKGLKHSSLVTLTQGTLGNCCGFRIFSWL